MYKCRLYDLLQHLLTIPTLLDIKKKIIELDNKLDKQSPQRQVM